MDDRFRCYMHFNGSTAFGILCTDSDSILLTRSTIANSTRSKCFEANFDLLAPRAITMGSSMPSDTLASLSLAEQPSGPPAPSTNLSSSIPSKMPPTTNLGQSKKNQRPKAKAQSGSNPNTPSGAGGKKPAPKPNPTSSNKLRGLEKDSPEVRISKTLSWLLRHGAQGEGLPMRSDGYVKVVDLVRR
jgi:hypothetical protein